MRKCGSEIASLFRSPPGAALFVVAAGTQTFATLGPGICGVASCWTAVCGRKADAAIVAADAEHGALGLRCENDERGRGAVSGIFQLSLRRCTHTGRTKKVVARANRTDCAARAVQRKNGGAYQTVWNDRCEVNHAHLSE